MAAGRVEVRSAAGSRQRNARYRGVSIGLGRLAVHAGRYTTLSKKNKSRQMRTAVASNATLVTAVKWSRCIDFGG
jgi:hypothetical protein